MIAFDFEYYKPNSLKEAVNRYKEAHLANQKAIYFSGGTEFITFARKGRSHADVVIDLKAIAECHRLEMDGNELVIGAAMSLNEIAESNYFPLLGDISKRIADHTSRNKITIGGNINSHLMYKETILALLLTDAQVEIIGESGKKRLPLEKIYKEKIQLKGGELLSQIRIPRENLQLPFAFMKRTKFSAVGYPVVSIASVLKDGEIRMAFSGLCAAPFRSKQMEKTLNQLSLPVEARIQQVVEEIPAPIIDDVNGSARYREFIAAQLIQQMMDVLEVKK